VDELAFRRRQIVARPSGKERDSESD
jgi:hypothetical protein